jgi:Cu/Ag efflux protein CusF
MVWLEGVVHTKVNLEEKAAMVHYDPTKVTPAQMIAAINSTGLRASLWEPPPGQRVQGQGTVRSIDLQKGTVIIDHGEVRGLMPPMVMEFVVDTQDALQGLKPGDTIHFTLRSGGLRLAIVDLPVGSQR